MNRETITQNLVVLSDEIYHSFDDETGATLKVGPKLSSIMVNEGQKIRKNSNTHVILVCDREQVSHLLGGFILQEKDLGSRLHIWTNLMHDPFADRRKVAIRLSEFPAGSYFVIPKALSVLLNFRSDFQEPGLHQIPLKVSGQALHKAGIPDAFEQDVIKTVSTRLSDQDKVHLRSLSQEAQKSDVPEQRQRRSPLIPLLVTLVALITAIGVFGFFVSQ